MKKVLLIALCFVAFITTANAQIFKKKSKKEVPGQTTVLTRHPDEIVLIGGKDQLEEYYLFFDIKNKCLFFTDKGEVYFSISEFLPERQIPGRRVEVDGPSINPLTIFTKDQLSAKSKQIGFGINKFNTFRLMNYSLIEASQPASQKNDDKVVAPEKKNLPADTLKRQKRDWGN